MSDIEVDQALCYLTWSRPGDSFYVECAKVGAPDRHPDSGTVIDKNSKVYEFARFWNEFERGMHRDVFPVVLRLEWAEKTSVSAQADVSCKRMPVKNRPASIEGSLPPASDPSYSESDYDNYSDGGSY